MSLIDLSTLITYNPIAVSPSASLVEIVEQMDQYGIHHVPVVGDDFQLLGIVSDLDVARTVGAAPKFSGSNSQPGDRPASLPVAEEMMVRSVVAIRRDNPPESALRAMLDHGFHSVPVVEDGRLVGIITSTDFLREFSYGIVPACRDPVARHMQQDVWQVESTATPEAALDLMTRHEQRYLAVTWNGRPQGVLSKRHLRQAQRIDLVLDGRWQRGNMALCRRARDVSELLTPLAEPCNPRQSMAEAALTMFERSCHGLAVVDETGRLAGIVSEIDVLRCLAMTYRPVEVGG